jgi:integrase
LFRKIYNDACRWGFASSNPIALVRKFRLPEQDFQFWSLQEVQQFLGYCLSRNETRRIFYCVVLALYTGMRRGEIIALKWDAINFESGFIAVKRAYCRTEKRVLEQTKSKKIRYIPICSMLLGYLDRLRPITYAAGYVCLPIHPDCFHKEFKKLARGAGVPVIRFHDLRHTFASNFLMGGGNIYDLQKILGHSTIQVTERYAHLTPGHLQGKTEVLGF